MAINLKSYLKISSGIIKNLASKQQNRKNWKQIFERLVIENRFDRKCLHQWALFSWDIMWNEILKWNANKNSEQIFQIKNSLEWNIKSERCGTFKNETKIKFVEILV